MSGPTVNTLAILWVGDAERPEFSPAAAELADLGQLTTRPELAAAFAWLRDAEPTADVMVLAQAYPGQFAQAAVDALRRLAPLARMISLLGSWCEGELRSGTPLAGTIRLYWHQWPARGRPELLRLARGDAALWALPATATDEDRLLAAAGDGAKRSGLVLVYAAEKTQAEWLMAACRLRGYTAVHMASATATQVEGAAAAIFDGGEFCPHEAEELRALAAAMPGVPIVALLEFPRIEDYHRALACGARAILSKPLVVDDLYWQLDQFHAEGVP